ncbi:alginate lyase family protein [Desulfonatronovibrio magnus]|uniref:alginate lyase family protein n=1 Tax=Desulfonatronovibrio magnus TaxID=698827 RepID=UPI000A5BA0F7|nr:alginate lyase family protein [Desulfonatronovibrio magnus]
MNIPWLLHRLSKMPLSEIPWRLLEKSKKIIDRRKVFACPDSNASFDSKIFQLCANAEVGRLQELFPESLNVNFSVARASMENRYQAFGVAIAFQDEIQWHLDPITKKAWPNKFWGDINYRDKNFGGVKFVWEFNRLYCLFALGLSYRITREMQYAHKILEIVASWLKGNPYPMGVNWSSGIESGVRLANLVWALSFLHDYPFSKAQLESINSFVWLHAIRLHRYPSRHSSANNHLLAEGFGLFAAGLYFPNMPEANSWLKQGRQILDAEAGRQILPDGGSFEYSTTYLSFVFDFFLLYRHMCLLCGLSYSPVVDERLEKACLFIHSIMDKDDNLPNIGDQDSAVLVNFGLSNTRNFSSILNTCAVLFKAPELATDQPDLKTWLLTGQIPQPAPNRQLLNRPEYWLHEHSGLAVIKDEVQAKEVLFVGNATPLGLAPLYAHGHLDALSFTLSVNGMELLVDPGTYLYHGGGNWREYFRSTAAHNTIRLNQQELSRQTGDFMFGRPYRITENSLQEQGGRIIWSASHDAFLKNNPQAQVVRKVVWDRSSASFTIADQIEARGNCFVELFFHCHPECLVVAIDNGLAIARGVVRLDLLIDPVMEVQILRGSQFPMAGWYSPGFNEIKECVTMRFYGTLPGKSEILTCMKVAFG